MKKCNDNLDFLENMWENLAPEDYEYPEDNELEEAWELVFGYVGEEDLSWD